MGLSRAEFDAGIKALVAALRQEAVAELLACESVGTPDPDETPEFVAGVIVEHEVHKAIGTPTTPHEEVMRDLFTPAWRWDQYLADSRELPGPERRRLDAAMEIALKAFGISPACYVRADEAPGKSVKLADVIALVVLQRQQWEIVPSE